MRVDPYSGQPSLIAAVDRFDDGAIDLDTWVSPVESGDLEITEPGGELKIVTTGATAGIAYLQSRFRWGKYAIIEVKLKVGDGEAAGDGERCEASLNLWKETNVYLKWGVYRDTSEAVNSSAYLRYNDGTGEVAVDCSGAPLDNVYHTFKLVIFESAVELYYDSTYITALAFNKLINYACRLEAGNQINGDTIDIRFDDFKIYNGADPFGTDLTGVESDLTSILADTATLLTRLSATRAGYLDYLANGTYGLSALNTDLDTLLTRLTSARAGYIDYLANATYGLSALNTDLDAIIASLAGDNISQGTGTVTLTNTIAVGVEFTTATYGSVFELTFIANTAKTTTGFEARAAADTIMTVEIYKKIENAWPALPQDIWAIQKSTTNTRNIDINMVKCGEDTIVVLQLDKNPSADVEIPYRWIVRRLKT